MNSKVLEKSRNLWESPESGNAVVVLHCDSGERIVIGDLDAGYRLSCHIDELTVKLRESEPEDFEYSWTSDCHMEIYNDALKRRDEKFFQCQR